MTIGPLCVFGIVLVTTYFLIDFKAMLFVLSMSVGGFVGGGKLVVLAGAIESAPIGVWAIASLVVLGDLATTLVIIANMHHLYRIPGLGRRLAAAREAGYRVLDTHKWMRRMTIAGLCVFVAVPFQGTGAVLGVILGRILGLSRLVIVGAVFLGASIGVSLVAVLAGFAADEITMLAENPVLGVFTVAASLVGTIFLGRWFLGNGIQSSE
ncbi:MAG: small multi-drug export protein [Deltaproteobacteria bacterium]|nr:small multi-drug export protein [Deltaproteobacteria bacterium]MBN2673880.1 small multi-drug export protein [Deltaproteobacteria bacterium]